MCSIQMLGVYHAESSFGRWACPWSISIIGKCAESLHAVKLLCHHGMSEDSLRHVYKAVILSELLYASLAWWGSTSAADKQRLEASIRCATRLGLYTADDPTPSQLAADMHDSLFANILNNPHHVLHKFPQDRTDHTCNLRSRHHSLWLTVKTDCNNFLSRLLL